jgi:mannose-6-phosphate isomerase-like protein (cupin superfamily)
VSIESILSTVASDPRRDDLRRELVRRREEALPLIVEYLRVDRPIEAIERFEDLLKLLLTADLSAPCTGRKARKLAMAQRELGFLLKYKSYAIKAASPLGYSVFFQNPLEGFSFQRHVTHKTEVFHILDVTPGGYVFLCEFDEWQQVYDPTSFTAWLEGAPDGRYDQFRHAARPGDVIVIDRLNVVHTVIGCVLAEFATISTDMVDRLHDQNAGRGIPPQFSRAHSEHRLRELTWPAASNRVFYEAGLDRREPIRPEPVEGGVRTCLGEGDVSAAAYRYERGALGGLSSDSARATSLHVVEGRGQLQLGEPAELATDSPPVLTLKAGDLLLIAPGAQYRFFNDGPTELVVAEQRIAPSVAFVGEDLAIG